MELLLATPAILRDLTPVSKPTYHLPFISGVGRQGSKPWGGACTGTGANLYLRRRSQGASSEPLCQHPRPTTPNPLADSDENGPRPEDSAPAAPHPSRRCAGRRQSLASHRRRSKATNACHTLPLTCIVRGEETYHIFILLSNQWRNAKAEEAEVAEALQALPPPPGALPPVETSLFSVDRDESLSLSLSFRRRLSIQLNILRLLHLCLVRLQALDKAMGQQRAVR